MPAAPPAPARSTACRTRPPARAGRPLGHARRVLVAAVESLAPTAQVLAPTGPSIAATMQSLVRTLRGQDGQASVELVALLPVVGVLALIAWQVLLAGGAIWFGGTAARAAARAEAVGADPMRAARGALPDRYEGGLRVRRERDGGVAVVVVVPTLLGDRSLGSVTTRAHFEAQR